MEKSQAKGQSSLEYITLVAITLVIIVPATYLFYNYSRDSTQEISDAQLTRLGREIIDTSEKIFYSGIGSRTVMQINLPEGVTSGVILDGKELVFNITSQVGVSEVVFFSAVNITTDPTKCTENVCTIPLFYSSGLKKIKIEAVSKDSVRIDPV